MTAKKTPPAAQSDPAARSATIMASFILGDGAGELVVLAPVQVPYETRWFETQIQARVVAVIQSEH